MVASSGRCGEDHDQSVTPLRSAKVDHPYDALDACGSWKFESAATPFSTTLEATATRRSAMGPPGGPPGGPRRRRWPLVVAGLVLRRWSSCASSHGPPGGA